MLKGGGWGGSGGRDMLYNRYDVKETYIFNWTLSGIVQLEKGKGGWVESTVDRPPSYLR
jgi:hypothetical protein